MDVVLLNAPCSKSKAPVVSECVETLDHLQFQQWALSVARYIVIRSICNGGDWCDSVQLCPRRAGRFVSEAACTMVVVRLKVRDSKIV